MMLVTKEADMGKKSRKATPAHAGHFPAAASFRFVAKMLFEDGLRRAIAWHHARIKAERASA